MRGLMIGAVIGTLAGGVALAQGQASQAAGPKGRQAVAERLGLTAEQRAEMQKVGVAFRKEHIRQRAELQVARLELRELLTAAAIDDKAVLAKAQEISQLQSAQTRRMIEHRLAVAKILTPEQRQQARSLGPRHRGRCAPGAARFMRERGRRHPAGWSSEEVVEPGEEHGPQAAFGVDPD
jgi:Spy/CpxP family protein refolding chaperone